MKIRLWKLSKDNLHLINEATEEEIKQWEDANGSVEKLLMRHPRYEEQHEKDRNN